MTITVDTSDYFIYENLLDSYTSFGVHSANSFGNVSGNGLQKITVNTKNKSVSVDGNNMDYQVWLKTEVNNYEYFYLEGENVSGFSVCQTQCGVEAKGLLGLQNSGFANAETMVPKTADLNFTSDDAFDLSQIEIDSTILFFNHGIAQAEVILPTFIFGKD